MAVLSMSKQDFSRLDVLLRVQSGRGVADACAPMDLHRRRYSACCVASRFSGKRPIASPSR
jgi:hypothetical protein